MMHRIFDTRFELDEFVDALIENGHYNEFIIRYESDVWHIYW